jgi:hypothetical protein
MNYTLQAEPGHVNVSPFGFHHYATHFLQVARSIQPGSTFSPVAYYLYCHSLELSLKAFLLVKGVSKEKLKKSLGHNLEAILTRADGLGLQREVPVTITEKEELSKANEYYCNKEFEYFEVGSAAIGYPDLPNLSILADLAEKLVRELKALCIAAA